MYNPIQQIQLSFFIFNKKCFLKILRIFFSKTEDLDTIALNLQIVCMFLFLLAYLLSVDFLTKKFISDEKDLKNNIRN